MALSQLRQMVIEGDRPAPAAAQQGMVKLQDGSLIMRGPPKAAIEQPGMLSGLIGWAKSRLNPAPAEPAPYWIPAPAAPVPAQAAPAPVAEAPGALPAYNDPWTEIEQVANREKALADQLGGVSKNILNNERLVQGRWFSNSAPKRVD